MAALGKLHRVAGAFNSGGDDGGGAGALALVSDACEALEGLAAEDTARARGQVPGAHPDPAHPDNLVSLKQLADLQVAIECVVAWGLLPALLRLGCFGELVSTSSPPSPAGNAETFAEQVRRPAKSLRITPATLYVGVGGVLAERSAVGQRGAEQSAAAAAAADRARWRAVLERCASSVAGCAVQGPHCHLLMSKNLGELALAECALRLELQGAAPAVRAVGRKGLELLFPDLPLGVRVRAFLDGLQTHQRLSRLVGASSSDRSKQVAGALGRQLSALVAQEGGVLAVMMEMLEHVPHGNTQAFQHVARLMIGRKEHLASVTAQLCKLLRAATLEDSAAAAGGPDQRKVKALVQRSVAITVNEVGKRFGAGALEKHVLPLLAPVLCPLSPSMKEEEEAQGSRERGGAADQVRLLGVLLDAAPPSVELVRALEAPACAAFELYAFAHARLTRGAGEARRLLRLWVQAAPPKLAVHWARVVVTVPYPLGFLGHVFPAQGPGRGVGGDDGDSNTKQGRPHGRRQLFKSADGAACWHVVRDEPDEEQGATLGESGEVLRLRAPTAATAAAADIKLVPNDSGGGAQIARASEGSTKTAVRQLEQQAEEELEVEADAGDLLALQRIEHALKLMDGLHASGPLFVTCLGGVAAIFRDSGASRRSRGDLLFVQCMLDEDAQRGLNKPFALARECVDVGALVQATAQLVGACATALGLQTFEAAAAAGGAQPDPDMAALALDTVPVALAIAASLASHDANDDLWGDGAHDGASAAPESRFAVLSALLEPLVALSRLGDGTARALAALGSSEGGVGGTSSSALASRCRELAETALGVRMSVFAASSSASSTSSPSSYARRIDACFSYDDSVLDPVGKSIDAAQKELQSEEPPVRAMGLDRLRDIVRSDGQVRARDSHFDAVVAVLTEALSDQDAYVYLTCIRALAACCEAQPVVMFPRLLAAFGGAESSLPIQARLRLGEVLKLSAHRAGATLPRFAPRLISALCLGASYRRNNSGSKQDTRAAPVTDEQGRFIPAASRPAAKSSSSSLAKEAAIRQTQADARDLLESSFRSSCLANLADVCALAPWVAFQHASTLISLAKSVLMFEPDSPSGDQDESESFGATVESARQLRRAAAYLLLQIAVGANAQQGNEALVEIPLALKELMRVANAASTFDRDAVVRLHCDRARATVDAIVKTFLFPTDARKPLSVSIPSTM